MWMNYLDISLGNYCSNIVFLFVGTVLHTFFYKVWAFNKNQSINQSHTHRANRPRDTAGPALWCYAAKIRCWSDLSQHPSRSREEGCRGSQGITSLLTWTHLNTCNSEVKVTTQAEGYTSFNNASYINIKVTSTHFIDRGRELFSLFPARVVDTYQH